MLSTPIISAFALGPPTFTEKATDPTFPRSAFHCAGVTPPHWPLALPGKDCPLLGSIGAHIRTHSLFSVTVIVAVNTAFIVWLNGEGVSNKIICGLMLRIPGGNPSSITL